MSDDGARPAQSLTPLETLFEAPVPGVDVPLPEALASVYGRLRLPAHDGRPHVLGNFVATLDGVVALGDTGEPGGGPISGDNPCDLMLMGLLRAVADAVVVGGGTARSVERGHLWTAEYIYPDMAGAYAEMRRALGKSTQPLTVIVTGSGTVDPAMDVFAGAGPVLVVTSRKGEGSLRQLLPAGVRTAVGKGSGRLTAVSVLSAVSDALPEALVLCEGGPYLIGDFLAEGLLDELFLTLAPQVAGRDGTVDRPGLGMGHLFAPSNPVWGELVGVKRGGSHLFLRYTFGKGQKAG